MVYHRLIALWAVCEALLGGLLHGLRLPVTGLLVGSASVICICLIAHEVPGRGRIARAALIVAAVKMMLSPHSPAPAYIALLFQGMAGELLFLSGPRFYRVSALLLALLALLESAVQRIISMTLIYGKELWTAVDVFIGDLTKRDQAYSHWIVGAYLLLHLLVGLFVGWFAGRLPQRMRSWKLETLTLDEELDVPVNEGRRSRFRNALFAIWLLLCLLLLQSWMGPGEPLLPAHLSIQLLLRSLLLLFTWYLFIGPVVLLLLQRWLQARANRDAALLQAVSLHLPSTRRLVRACWLASSRRGGLQRILHFSRLVLANTLKNG